MARWAHNPKVGGSNPPPATKHIHKVTGNWALAATVQNCPIRGTAPQFLFFIEWRPVDWQAFLRGVAQLAGWPCIGCIAFWIDSAPANKNNRVVQRRPKALMSGLCKSYNLISSGFHRVPIFTDNRD
jgi:hypothetical protein